MSEQFMKELNDLRYIVYKRGYVSSWIPFRCAGVTFRLDGPRGKKSISTGDIEKIRSFITSCGIELETEAELAQRIIASYE